MKIHLIFSLLILSCFFTFANAQISTLAPECRKILNKKFPGWKYGEIRPDISEYFKSIGSNKRLNSVKGDWNGDGSLDYAVLIEHGKLKNYLGEVIGNRRLLIPFIRTSKGFRHFVFYGAEYITAIKKGSKDYNYETDKNFHYKTDAIFDGFFEKAGVSYVWNKTKFKVIVTSD